MVLKEDFAMVYLSAFHRGIMKMTEKSEMVMDIKVLEYADETDNEWLVEQALLLYKAYFERVFHGGDIIK